MALEINGSVSPGYESVRTLFASHLARNAENQAQLCVYVKGIKVVDLWGSSEHGRKACKHRVYHADSLQIVFSSGKTLAAIVVAMMVDRGLLDYDEKVVKYWPEFGQMGKQNLTLKDVLRHEAGLTKLCKAVKLEDTSRESIKANKIGEIIAKTASRYPRGSIEPEREYHAFTRGWILNEVVRRVDPRGRTIGEILLEEVCTLLDADVHIGVKKELLPEVFDVDMWNSKYVFFQSLIPSFLGRKTETGILDYLHMWWAFNRASKKAESNDNQDKSQEYPEPLDLPDGLSDGLGFVRAFTWESAKTGEIPSANSICSARGLAKVASCIAEGGELEGKRILSEETIAKMHEEPVDSPHLALEGLRTSFSKGGVNHFRYKDSNKQESYKLREGFVGWMGLGGSVMQWHPELRIGFGYAKTLLHWYDVYNSRGAMLQDEVVKCVRALQMSEDNRRVLDGNS